MNNANPVKRLTAVSYVLYNPRSMKNVLK